MLAMQHAGAVVIPAYDFDHDVIVGGGNLRLAPGVSDVGDSPGGIDDRIMDRVMRVQLSHGITFPFVG
jgi:hypothetical protein